MYNVRLERGKRARKAPKAAGLLAKVMSWSIETIESPEQCGTVLDPAYSLPRVFRDGRAYYASFIPFLFEEARAVVANGSRARFSAPVQLVLDEVIVSESSERAQLVFRFGEPLNLSRRAPSGSWQDIARVATVILLCYSGTRLPTFAVVKSFDGEKFKCTIAASSLPQQLGACEDSHAWSASSRGFLTSLIRVYETLREAHDADGRLITSAIGNAPTHVMFASSSSDEENDLSSCATSCSALEKTVKPRIASLGPSRLNPSQRRALDVIINGGVQGAAKVHLVQGPPGTGKTVFVTELIRTYISMKNRVATCSSTKIDVGSTVVMLKDCNGIEKGTAVLVTGVTGEGKSSSWSLENGTSLKKSDRRQYFEAVRGNADLGSSVLVCAPSNAAVLVLVRRFLEILDTWENEDPKPLVALLGVKEKLVDNMENVANFEKLHPYFGARGETTNRACCSKIKAVKDPLSWKSYVEFCARPLGLSDVFVWDAADALLCRLRFMKLALQPPPSISAQSRSEAFSRVLFWLENARRKLQRISSFDACRKLASTLAEASGELARQIAFEAGSDNKSGDMDLCISKVGECVGFLDGTGSEGKAKTNAAEVSLSLAKGLINDADVIFCTLSTAGSLPMIHRRPTKPCYLAIVDEAAQAIEAETIICLRHLKSGGSMCLVGDPCQLPATVISCAAQKAGFGRSMMSRLMQRGIDTPNFPQAMLLQTQYRMAPNICHWPSRQFYEGQLKNATTVNSRIEDSRWRKLAAKVFGKEDNFLFVDHEFPETRSKSASLSNPGESRKVKEVLERILAVATETLTSVQVLTFYEAQRALLVRNLASLKARMLRNLKVRTVDSAQGSEADLVIISFVRSNVCASVGFLSDFRRLNVSLTRAKHLWYVTLHRHSLCEKDQAEHIIYRWLLNYLLGDSFS